MRKMRFTATIYSGHKEDAFELPFDPAETWGVPARPLWTGRRGHRVRGTLNGTSFESVVVPRSRKFWVLVDAKLKRAAKVEVGDSAEAIVELADD